MDRTDHRIEALRKLFKKNRIVDIKKICKAVESTSRVTAFRYLRQLDYVTSYNHAGRYYTLRSLVRFDKDGLWQHDGVLFSKMGTLQDSLVNVINSAYSGYTQSELCTLLKIRVQNSLNILVGHRSIDRKQVLNCYLYISSNTDVAKQQIKCRKDEIENAKDLEPVVTIDILLEVVRTHERRPFQLARRLRKRGIEVSGKQIERMFSRYSIDREKK